MRSTGPRSPVRCRRDDELDESVESAPTRDVELRRYREAGALRSVNLRRARSPSRSRLPAKPGLARPRTHRPIEATRPCHRSSRRGRPREQLRGTSESPPLQTMRGPCAEGLWQAAPCVGRGPPGDVEDAAPPPRPTPVALALGGAPRRRFAANVGARPPPRSRARQSPTVDRGCGARCPTTMSAS